MGLESNPELAREPDSALRIALGYWIANKISTVGAATGDPVKAVTKRINSKLVWLSDRQAYFRKAIKVFAPPPAVAVAVAAALEQPVIPEKGVEPMRSSAS
jgi:hypothetical protein